MTHVVLLDIDSVLIRPGGYRAAVRSTLNHVLKEMGLPPQAWDNALLNDLEARGITSEWDMTALLLATFLDDLLGTHPDSRVVPASLEAAIPWFGRHVDGASAQEVTVPAFTWRAGETPSDAALRLGMFPHLPEGLRRDLLGYTRDVSRAYLTRLFQNFTLGSAHFRRTYGQSPPVESESLLERHDRPLIPPAVRRRLWKAWQRRDVWLCAFTARPTLPPRGATTTLLGYPPEAELALKRVAMDDLPLIGYGKLAYIGARHGLKGETLLKPSPVQALAAIGAALHGDELRALEEAIHWQRTGEWQAPQGLHVHVVEDTGGGVRAVQAAVQALQSSGQGVQAHLWGLAPKGSAKETALARLGATCHSRWETLLPDLLAAVGNIL